MAMNINPVASQIPAQLYQNNQTEAPRSLQQDTSQGVASKDETQVTISPKARELQTQRLQDAQEASEAEATADNEQTEQAQNVAQQGAGNAGNQIQAYGGPRNTINLVA